MDGIFSLNFFPLAQLFRQRASSTWCWNFSGVEIYSPDYPKRLAHSFHGLLVGGALHVEFITHPVLIGVLIGRCDLTTSANGLFDTFST